jgi:hypothetical protein
VLSSEGGVTVAKAARPNRFDPIARARRAGTQRRQAKALKAWNPVDKPEWLDEKAYRESVQPHLSSVVIPKIMTALSVSEPYALKIRAGRCIPHPRHWLSLARLVGVSPDE